MCFRVFLTVFLAILCCDVVFVKIVLLASDNKSCEIPCVKGNKGIKVSVLARYGLYSGDKEAEKSDTNEEAVYLK